MNRPVDRQLPQTEPVCQLGQREHEAPRHRVNGPGLADREGIDMTQPNDIFAAGLQALAQQASHDAARNQGIKTLGEIRRALEKVPADTPVRLDTGAHPGSVDSYRGYYERLAISIGEPTTAGGFVKVLDDADGATFYGYKGGDYRMHSGTFLHVAEYGDCGRAVVGVRVDEGAVIIETAEEDW